MSRPLVVAAHGTADVRGQAAVLACAQRAAELIGLDEVRVGYVDVCGPTLADVLAGLVDTEPVVVPYFLASGHHVRSDVPAAVEPVPGATVTPALGADDLVLTALTERITEVDPEPDAVVVVGAGSSVEAARAEVAQVADRVGSRLDVPTLTAFLSGPGERPEQQLEVLHGAGHRRIVLAAHLLSPGYFLERVHAIAAEAGPLVPVTGPLGTHPALARLVARRYANALARAS